MKDFPLAKVYQLLEPGPVVLLATAEKDRPNVMTMSWHMMMDFEPPLIGCIISSANYNFRALKAAKECVIAIPGADLASKIVKIGNCSGRNVDKFSTIGLTPVRAARVAPPLITECFANLECKVRDASLVDRYDLFVLEAVKAWIDPARKNPKTLHHRGYGTFVVDGETIRLKSKMR